MPRAASADTPPDVNAAAQALFEEGRAAVREGRFAAGCGKLAESQRLDPGIGIQLWLADCYENNGQTASAWATFKEAAAASALKHDPRERVARERAAALEESLPRLLIAVSPDADTRALEIGRDGLPAGQAQWGIGVPVDPGVHTIVARSPGRRQWTASVRVPPGGGLTRVAIPKLELLRASAAEAPVAGGEPREAPSSSPSSTGGPQRWIGVSVACAGLLGLGLGAYYSLSAKAAYDSSNDAGHCVDNRCDGIGRDDRRTAFDRATISTVAFALGGAAAAGGAVIFLTAPRQVTISAGPTVGGGVLRVSRAW
jgi:hypothetical protein